LESGVFPSVIGLWPIHIGAFIIGTTLLIRGRSSGLKFKAKMPKRNRVKISHKKGTK
jgi:lipopolysaccharide export system permease protein